MYTADRDEHIDKQTDLCMYISLYSTAHAHQETYDALWYISSIVYTLIIIWYITARLAHTATIKEQKWEIKRSIYQPYGILGVHSWTHIYSKLYKLYAFSVRITQNAISVSLLVCDLVSHVDSYSHYTSFLTQ